MLRQKAYTQNTGTKTRLRTIHMVYEYKVRIIDRGALLVVLIYLSV